MLYGFLKVGYEYGLSPVYSSQEVTWYKPSLVNEGVYPVSFESDSQTLKVKQTFDRWGLVGWLDNLDVPLDRMGKAIESGKFLSPGLVGGCVEKQNGLHG